jgi:hypothetical protein
LETIDFQDKRWQVINKVEGHRIDDHTTLKKSYGCDLVLKNSNDVFYILNELIEAEFDDIK